MEICRKYSSCRLDVVYREDQMFMQVLVLGHVCALCLDVVLVWWSVSVVVSVIYTHAWYAERESVQESIEAHYRLLRIKLMRVNLQKGRRGFEYHR